MANAILYDILEAVRSDLVALDLPGLAAANVVVHKVVSTRVADLPAVQFPCVVIAPWGRESVEPHSNLRDTVGYPVVVAIIDKESTDNLQPQSDQLQQLNMYLQWRETIRHSFSYQRLSTLAHTVRIESLDIVDKAAWEQKGLWVSGLVLRCLSIESRG